MASPPPFNPFAFNPFQEMTQAYFSGLNALAQSAGSMASGGKPDSGAGFGAMPGFQQMPAMNPMAAIEPMLKGMARCQLEAIGFAAKRAQAYMEIPSRLALVRTPQDLMNEQMRFWQTAVQQYQDGSRRIMASVTSMSPHQGFAASNANPKPRRRDYMNLDDPAPARGANGTSPSSQGPSHAPSKTPTHGSPLRVA